jgi:hypothetical protein
VRTILDVPYLSTPSPYSTHSLSGLGPFTCRVILRFWTRIHPTPPPRYCHNVLDICGASYTFAWCPECSIYSTVRGTRYQRQIRIQRSANPKMAQHLSSMSVPRVTDYSRVPGIYAAYYSTLLTWNPRTALNAVLVHPNWALSPIVPVKFVHSTWCGTRGYSYSCRLGRGQSIWGTLGCKVPTGSNNGSMNCCCCMVRQAEAHTISREALARRYDEEGSFFEPLSCCF